MQNSRKLRIRGRHFHFVSRSDRSKYNLSLLFDCLLWRLCYRHCHNLRLSLLGSLLWNRFLHDLLARLLFGNPRLSILHILMIDRNVLGKSIYTSRIFNLATFIAITNENGTIIIRVGSKIRQKLPIHSSHRDVRVVLHLPELRPALCVFRSRMRNVHSERLRQQSELIAYESDLCKTSTNPSEMLHPLHFVISVVNKSLIEERKMRRSPHKQIRLLEDMVEAAFEHKAHRRREAVPSIHHIILWNTVSTPNTCVSVSGRKVVHSPLSIHAASCSFV